MKPYFRAFACFYCLLLLLLQSAQISAYYYSGFLLRDLNDDTTFATDASAWTAYPAIKSSTIYYNCGGTLLLGGYCVLGYPSSGSNIGFYFQRVYQNLPAHNYIRFSMNFWAIDSWDLTAGGHQDGFEISFDGLVLDGWHMSLSSFPYQICGSMTSGWNEMPRIMVSGLIAHSASTLTFRVISDLDEESCNESFGFRDLQFVFDQNAAPGSPAVNSICGRGPESIRLPNKNCNGYSNCALTQYQVGTTCYNCNSLCSSCAPSTSASDCYGCVAASNVIWDGTECIACVSSCATCSGASTNCVTCISNYYLIPWTNQCVIRCPWPLVICTSYPTQCCSPCDEDQFVMTDGTTCSSTCPAPYQPMNEMSILKTYQPGELTVVKICLVPCSPIEYLYWDGTCGQDCGSPLVITDTGYDGRKLCTFPCTYDYQYAYWDGSCASSCDPPRITHLQNGRRLCRQPCLGGQSLDWIGECVNICPVYHTATTVGGILYCNYPCGVIQYLYWDGVCRDACPFPLNTRVQNFRQYCDYPASSGNYLYWDGSSVSSCPLPFTGTSQYTAAPRLFCDYGCEWGYTYWDSSCVDECPYPLTTTIVKNRQYCGFSCTGSNYLYWNGTCSGSCNPPLVSRQYLLKNFCDYPCLTSQYLYWDGACSFTCAGIFVIRQEGSPMVRNFCDFPCLPEYYYYWNSSCISVCPPPLIASTDRSRLYCNFPCLEGQFYYYNGTCSYTCDRDSTQVIMSTFEKYCVESQKYVVTCHDDDFYYWNNTCKAECPAPLMQSQVGDQKWCIYPCLVNQFLYSNGTCLDTCEPPFTERIENEYKYCDYSCDPSEYFYWNNTCLPSCPMPFRHEITSYGVNCLLPCESETKYYDINTETCVSDCASSSVATGDLYPICLSNFVESPGSYLDLMLKAPETKNSFSLVTIPTILHHVRYLNMPLPPRLKNLVVSKGRNIMSLDFGSDMPQRLSTSFTKRPLPEIFEQRGLHSSFIVNFWPRIMSWVLVITALFILIIFEKMCTVIGWTSAKVYLETLKLIVKWNLCLILLATSVGDVVFYSLIEFISINPHLFTSFSSILLLFTILSALTVMVVAIFNLVRSFSVVKRRVVLHKDHSDYSNFVERWKEFQILFRGFRGHSNLNQYFFLLYMFRIAFPMIIAVFVRSSPLAQTILQVIFSFVVVSYILTAIPLVRKINFLQLFIVESLAFIVNFSLLLLYILNKVDAKHSREYNLLGDIVVGGCSTINLMAIIFLVVKVFEGIRVIDRYVFSCPAYPRTIWLQLLVFICQQCGMGFEEMFVNSEAARIFNKQNYLIKNMNNKARAEYQQALQDRARGAFSNSQPLKSTEQGSTMASFFNSSKDMVIEPIKTQEVFRDKQVGFVSDLIHKREDSVQSELRPFYWLQGITRQDGDGPKNAKKPNTGELSRPSVSSGSRSHSHERSHNGSQERKRQDLFRNRSHERNEKPQDLRSHDAFKKKSLRKHKKKQGQPSIRHL